MSSSTIDLRVIASTASAEASLVNVGTVAERELGGRTKKAAENANSGVGSLVSGFAKVAAVAGAGLIGKDVIDDTMAEQKAMALLGNSLDDTHQKLNPEDFDKTAKSMENFGHDNAETADSLTTLVRAGIPVNKALDDMQIIANLAAAKHMTLADATEAVAKSANGRMSPALKEMGIHLAAGQKGADALQSIMGQLAPKVQGAGDAASNTATGGLGVLHARMSDLFAKVGTIGLPVLSGAVKVLGFITDHAKIMIPVIGILTAALLANTVVTKAVAMWTNLAAAAHGVLTLATNIGSIAAGAFNIAMDANPIMLIVLAVAALVAAFVLLVTHLSEVGNFFHSVFSAISNFFSTGPWKVLADTISAPFKIAIGVIGGIIGGIVTVIQGIVGGVGKAIKAVTDAISAPFKTVFNFIADLWNNTLGRIHFDIPGWVPVIGGKGFGFPTIPKMHGGGLVPGGPTSEIMALLQGGEAVLTRQQQAALTSRAPGGGSSKIVNVNAPITVQTNANPNEIARQLAYGIRTKARMA